MDVHTAMKLGEDHRRRVIGDMRHVQVHRSHSGQPGSHHRITRIILRLRSIRPASRLNRPAIAG